MKLALALAACLLAPAAAQKPGQRRNKPPPAPKPPVLNITCWPDRVEFAGEGSVPTPNPIAAALGRAGPGTRIAVQSGDYPAFSVGFNKNAASNARTPGGNANQPVTVEGVGKVRILPGKASDTVCISQQVPVAWITFKNLEIHCGYRAGIFFFGGDASLVFAGFKFIDCDVTGDFDHRTGQGVRSKWAVYGRGLRDFEFRGVSRRAQIRDVRAEHGFYLQVPKGDIRIENVDAMRLGRTFCQFTARPQDGPPGVGTITIRNCKVSDCGLSPGDDFKGGSAFTFAGNLTGTILVERCSYRAGFDPSLRHLTRKDVPFGTGAFVAWDAGGPPNGTLILKDDDFEMAPGCGDRPLVSIGGCRVVRLEGANRFVAGEWPVALQIDPLREDGTPVNSPVGTVSISPETAFQGTVRKGDVVLDAQALRALASAGPVPGK